VTSNIRVSNLTFTCLKTGSTGPFKKLKQRQRSAQQKETQTLRGEQHPEI
jgi:hypothetical protein